MLIFLDTNVVIYLIEQPATWGIRAATRIGLAQAQSDRLCVNDIVRLESRVGPLSHGNAVMLARFDAFFSAPDTNVFALTGSVCDSAAAIRAKYRFRLADALNLASALEAGCDIFLTNDTRLNAFSGLTIEVLP